MVQWNISSKGLITLKNVYSACSYSRYKQKIRRKVGSLMGQGKDEGNSEIGTKGLVTSNLM